MPIEVYLGLAATVAGFYFLWGVYDPRGQQDTEYRWMHAALGRVTFGTRFAQPKMVRTRNVLGLIVCLVFVMMAVIEFNDDKEQRALQRSRAVETRKTQEDAQEFDATLRHQQEKAEAYYRSRAPGAQPYP